MKVDQICADLVAIRSENPPDHTSDVIEYIRGFLDSLGIGSLVATNVKKQDNLVTTGDSKPLLLCGHVDVVPAIDDSWKYPPFSSTIKDGYVWGRGASDMKGGCAALLAASRMLVEKGQQLPAQLAFVCDEETGGENGIRYLLKKKLLTPCDCLIAEPTPLLSPCIGQKGLCRLSLKFSGEPGHGSLYPVIGISAIMEAIQVLNFVKILPERSFPLDQNLKDLIKTSTDVFTREFNINKGHDILERITFNPGVISGGEKSNVVAQHCDLDLEMRIPWGCNIQTLIDEIMGHASRATLAKRSVFEPSITDPSCNFVSLVCREIEKVQAKKSLPIVHWAASDARHLRYAGFRVVEYGPGDLSTIHGINERVSVDALMKATHVYHGIMQEYCRHNPSSG